MTIADPQPAVPKPKRRWFQFSLRTLMIFVTACAVAGSWLAVKVQRAKRQRESVAAIGKAKGRVRYDYEFHDEFDEPPGPVWLRDLLGIDFVANAVDATIGPDGELQALAGLPHLQRLRLGWTNVTDIELQHLTELSHLEYLGLNGTQVTDAGLERLKGMSQLGRLDLRGTQVTDQGVQDLRQVLPHCMIYYEPPTKDERQSPSAPDQLR
jgi:hypothetical protein